MVRAKTKDLLRTAIKTKNRFLSIFFIAALGVAFFAGLRASSPDMIESTDRYSDDQNIMHFRLVSTWGFDREDVDRLSALEGIQVQPSYYFDSMVICRSRELAARFFAYDKQSDMNQLTLVSGSFPEKPDECVVHVSSDVELGSRIELPATEQDGQPMLSGSFVVVGKVSSAMFVSRIELGNTTVGSGEINMLVYVPQEAFNSDVYTQLYLVFDDMVVPSAYTDVYDALEQTHTKEIEQVAALRAPERYQQALQDAGQQISDNEAELMDGQWALHLGKRELEQAQQALRDGQEQIRQGEQTLQEQTERIEEATAALLSGQAELEYRTRQLADASVVLDDSRMEYESGYAQYAEQVIQAQQQFFNAQRQMEQAQQKLDDAAPLLEMAQLLYSQAQTIYDKALQEHTSINARYEQAVAENEDSSLLEWLKERSDQVGQLLTTAGGYLEQAGQTLAQRQQEYDAGAAALAAARVQYSASVTEAEAAMKAARSELDAGKSELDDGYVQFLSALSQLAGAQRTINNARQQIEDGQKQLREGTELLEQKREQLRQGHIDYAQGLAEYNKNRAALRDGFQQLSDAKQQLHELKEPSWYIFTRSDNNGYAEYGENAQRIRNISKIFPAFFILVAALVCINTMTRMVDEERVQMGTLKSLGYGNGTILGKYMLYCVSATVLGSVFGLAVGYKVFPFVIMKAYNMIYRVDVTLMPFRFTDGLIITLVSAAVSALTVLWCCIGTLRESPAQLLRARAPSGGRRVVLERIFPRLWRRLSFFGKVTVRNLIRYKKRMVMTVIGVAGCTALLLTGFGLSDSINDILKKQFGQVWHYSAMAAVDGLEEDRYRQICDMTARFDAQSSQMLLMQKSYAVSAGGASRSAYIMVTREDGDETQFITLKNRVSGTVYQLADDGVILTEKLATMLDISVGDSITIQINDTKAASVPVTGITENYVHNYIYMTPRMFLSVSGQAPEYNRLFIRFDLNSEQEHELAAQINSVEGVMTVSLMSDLYNNFSNVLKALNYVVIVLIVSAAALAFVVHYNLANLNITERIREIATLEVLGFEDREISAYIFRESIILTLIGTFVGLGIGRLLLSYVVKTAEIDITMFGREVHPLSYILSVVLTIAFSLIVDLYMHKPLKKISMVESLKSVD